ncbi:MAG TPA: nitroreductase family protein [Nocardioides sp.]
MPPATPRAESAAGPTSDRAPRPGAEGLAEPLRSRWSPSVFDDRHELDDAEVAQLLHAAQWAPSCGNTQPATFLVCGRGTPSHKRLVATLSRGNAGWVPRASVVFVGVARVDGEDDPDNGCAGFATYDVGQAAAHLTLQAHAMGLHAHQFAGFDRDALAAEMGVPDTHRVLAGIAVGVLGDPAHVDERTAGRDRKVRVRRGLDELAFTGRWGEEPWRGDLR